MTQHTVSGQTVWIIGCSSGIGKALATELAQQGAKIILSARRQEQLESVRDSLQGTGHRVYPLDISHPESIKTAIHNLTQDNQCIHRVVLLSAMYQPTTILETDLDFVQKTWQVNVFSAFELCQTIIPIFEKQGYGQIALCGSVAGYVGLPNGQPYSASKAGLINFTESLRAELAQSQTLRCIDVKIINPGFVRTPMTDKNKFSMPFRIEPEQAGKALAKGLCAKGFEIHFPKVFTYIMKCISILPYGLQNRLINKIKG